MAKPILYYTLARSRWTPEHAVVFCVTSEGPRGRINGRFLDGYPSHTTVDDCIGKFNTRDQANNAWKRIQDVNRRHGPGIAKAKGIYQELDRARRREVDEVVFRIRNGEHDVQQSD